MLPLVRTPFVKPTHLHLPLTAAHQSLSISGMARDAGVATPVRPTPARPESTQAAIKVRFLTVADIPALMELELAKWDEDQATNPEVLQLRIESYPRYCIAAFCVHTGKMLASLFIKPISDIEMQACNTWADAAAIRPSADDGKKASLFGISMSSINKDAVEELFLFIIPLAVKDGKRHVYLGSPIPGLKKWREKNPQTDVAKDYVFVTRNGLPVDPQLRYYNKKGFNTIMSAKPEYFPHADSMNYGAVLRMALPLP